MLWIRIGLFVCTVATVRFIFKSVNDDGDKKIEKMKELINFTQYLRVYSCQMKMSIEEIYKKYNFKSLDGEMIVSALINCLADKKGPEEFLGYTDKIMYTPIEFNILFAEILDYYGQTYSEVLDSKLKFTTEEMVKILNDFTGNHKEKKELNNRISLLAGCLVGIILL